MAEEGAVTVCVRVRPLVARENAASGDKVQLHWKSENSTILQVDGGRTFNYDCVFHSNDSTQQVYEGVAVPIIKSAVQGYNGTIFAYGQTASGKTYTMMGSDKSMGIIPKAVQDVFKIICEIPGREFLLRVSYMEIYNETITDLLCDSRKNKPLGIREDVNRNIYVEDLIEEVVVNPEQVMEWLRRGEKNRHYGETKMNEHSSRSHTIFRMIIESRENDPANTNCDGAVMVSHLNLVDLAGSERARQTGSEGLRLKEGCNINRSLFILGQVIKKLCDDPSGFINYRDSKLTRILQNSLGGNAKTVIICTITPVSFDETLSTLQFANTAKRMRNTPKVNEVLDDDALLKRYRKEIVDLKRQLEEVSSKTHLHAMEKDQLAQLLEEKSSLQKIQENRILNLTEMLVTSSSFTSQKDVKAKRKRRVTWAPGKIIQGDISYFANFEKLKPTDAKKMKTLAEKLPEMEDSMFSEYSEYDYPCLSTPDAISENEWNSGANMNWSQKDFADSVQLCETLALEKDIARNEVNALQANFDNLVLESEQLKLEISELKEKLREKIETDEFEELEKQTQKDHEIQLIHEITNLQNIVKNAEVYNEDLETDLKSKLEQLKEKENQVKDLQKYVEELQKAGMGKKDVSFSMGDSDKLLDEIQLMSKSLVDTETVALDAKKESAFLRSENLELKEKMNELLNGYKQMEKDVQLYQSQLEAGKVSYKKMQVDLQRELQSAFQENAKLTALLEGKVPKDLLSLVELERKIADLKNELDKVLEENTILRKEVDTSSEFKSLPDKVEMLQKQLSSKIQELQEKTAEQEQLLDVKEELSQAQQRLSEMEQLKEKSKTNESRMETERMEKLAIAQKLQESQEEVRILIQERDDLKQKQETLQSETDQLKEDIQETVAMNILAQEELRNAQSSLKQYQKTIEELEKDISEKRSEILNVQDTLGETVGELELKILQLTEELKQVTLQRDQLLEEKVNIKHQEESDQLSLLQEEIWSLTQEKTVLQQKLESLQVEKKHCEECTSPNAEMQEELRNAYSSLKQLQETIKELKGNISEKETQLSQIQETLGKTINDLKQKVIQLSENLTLVSCEHDKLLAEKERIEQIMNERICLQLQEISSVTQRDEFQQILACVSAERDQLKVDIEENKERSVKIQAEMENLQEELKCQKEQVDAQKNLIVEREKELLKTEEKLTEETTQLKEKIEKLNEELNLVSGERNRLLSELREKTEGKNERIQQLEEQSSSLTAERDKLQHMLETVGAEKNKLEVDLHESKEKSVKIQAEIESLHEELKKQVDTQKNLMVEREKELLKTEEKLTEETTQLKEKIKILNEELNLVSGERNQLLNELREKTEGENERIQQLEEQSSSLTAEREKLQHMLETVRAEKNKLEVDLHESIEKVNQLTEALNSVLHERHQLVAESTNHHLQLQDQISSINQEKDELQQILEGVKSERDLLKTELQKNIDMCTETNAKLECALDELKQKNLNDVAVQATQSDDTELRHEDSMKAKTLEVKELLEKFLMMEKKYECLTTVSLNLKSELSSQKALIAGMLTHLSPEQAKQVKRLQTENEKISNHLQSLLNKLKFLFSRVFQKKAEHYTTINNHEMELLDEKRKQDELLSQIRCLKKTCLKQDETVSQELNIHELQQKLDLHIEHILRDMSEIETELLSIDAELQQEESTRKEAMQFLETCSGNPCDVEKLKEGIKQDNERLLQVIKFWKPKVKTLLQISSEMDTRTTNYCKDSEIELKQRKGKTEELFEQLKTIKEQLAPCGVANLALEEENARLCNQLKATEQDIKIMKTTIQKLENAVNEAGKNVKEKEEKIAMLQTIKTKAAASELKQLQTKLNETEQCLRNVLTEKQTFKAKLDKGATLYKEEIDHLKTQLVKADMERMKQSRIFEQEIATTKALAEHKEEQLRKLKEELRRAQQEQDVTVISGKDVPQESHIPLTCGGGSGIVQSTLMLILKSEQAKLQKENLQLKKNNDLLVSNELQLKEELTKWKERALKMRAQSCRDTTREKIQRSPRKTAPCSVKEQMPSPSKEVSSREILPLDSPNTLPLTCPNFFDNSSLGTLTDTRPEGTECTEDRFKHWFGASEKDKAPDCTTQ
ncbi:centromere-associated protein E isoform 1-T1 [Macrochelys suwanniensis]